MSKNCIVLDISIKNKGRLEGRNSLWEERFQPISKDLGDKLVDNVAQTYRPKLIDRMRATTLLRNGRDEGVILLLQ